MRVGGAGGATGGLGDRAGGEYGGLFAGADCKDVVVDGMSESDSNGRMSVGGSGEGESSAVAGGLSKFQNVNSENLTCLETKIRPVVGS